jgi:MFS family permease
MTATSHPRPSQVTLACWFVIVASVFLVVSVFDTMGTLHSVDMRERLTTALSGPTTKNLGVSVTQALAIMRVGLLVAGATGAAAAVLGGYALQRNRGARVALAIVAVPIVLSAPFSGGFLAAVIGASTAMLWTPAARDWFAGREPRPAPARREAPARPDTPPYGTPPFGTPPPSSEGRPSYPSAPVDERPPAPSPYVTGGQVPPPTARYGDQPVPFQLAPPPTPAAPGPTPAGVRIACMLTWVFAGLVALLYLGIAVVLVVSPGLLEGRVLASSAWQDSGQSDSMLRVLLWVGTLGFLGWALGACVLAWLVLRRQQWAWILLIISSVAAGIASVVAFPVSIAHIIGIGATISLLLSQQVRAWMRPTAPRGPQQPPGQQSSGQQPSGRPPVW